jgi:hypothetical protein
VNLEYAIDRLYATGWTPAAAEDVETLADGRRFPSNEAIRREFEQSGLKLHVAYTPQFKCYRATWTASGVDGEEFRGTVIGACEREAAVYAFAQLRLQQQQSLVGV